MVNALDGSAITQYHDALVRLAQDQSDHPANGPGAWIAIAANHRFNCLLWREEDKARRQDVPAADIAAGKRRIDAYNQQRTDAVEAIDEAILAGLAGITPSPEARLSSETAGAMIDRLSILALKIHHMRVQTQRLDAGASHVEACAARLQRLLGQRAGPGRAMTSIADVLVPTCERPAALAVTLTALAAQTGPSLRILVSDQSERLPGARAPEVLAVLRYLRARGVDVEVRQHLPRRGMAEQRAFLLSLVTAPYCLYLDDDVIREPGLVARLHAALVAQECGFVGSAVHGLSYLGQERPAQEQIEFWEGRVQPETVRPGSTAWQRHHLHSAANLFHVQSRAADRADRLYRVAWIGGCVLFDTDKLRACGGFDFWRELPPEHCGEDVLAQLRVMERYGGCGLLPSGASHMELPTTVTAREVDAPYVLPGSSAGAAAESGAGGAARA